MCPLTGSPTMPPNGYATPACQPVPKVKILTLVASTSLALLVNLPRLIDGSHKQKREKLRNSPKLQRMLQPFKTSGPSALLPKDMVSTQVAICAQNWLTCHVKLKFRTIKLRAPRPRDAVSRQLLICVEFGSPEVHQPHKQAARQI